MPSRLLDCSFLPPRPPRRPGLVLIAMVALAGLGRAPDPRVEAADPARPEDGQWPMAAKDYANTRFSGLEEITTENVKDLKVAWTFSTGIARGQEAAPVVVGSTMYVVTPFPNFLYALDLKNSGAIKWKYDPKPAAAAQGVACCDVVNRGCAFDGGRIFYATLDGHAVAVDAETGKEAWKTKLGDINKGETITMAPIVVKGKVLVGNSGGELGVRGWIQGLDARTGKVAWTAFNTGPDADCKIGPRFKPFYPQDSPDAAGKDLGVKTWPPGRWKTGGGTVWGWISYDPGSNLIFHGTGNPGPWNADLRPGDNKWTCGVFARDPETGEAAWFYQFNPHDVWDHDGINENLVLDIPIEPGGAPRKVIVNPGRNGYVYVIDRATGQVLSATKYVRITSSKGVDLASGRLVENEEKHPVVGKVVRDITPIHSGAKDWSPSAYSPRTGLLYMPNTTMAMDWESTEVGYIAGTPYVGANVKTYADPVDPGDGSRGAFLAWDIAEKTPRWKVKEPFPVFSGAVVTAGDVVFYGTMDGWFKALDARSGRPLWKFKTGSGIIGQPVTYRGPDGKQYVAILAGVGGWPGAIVAGDLDARDPTGALGYVGGMRDLPQHTTRGDTLYVFSLP